MKNLILASASVLALMTSGGLSFADDDHHHDAFGHDRFAHHYDHRGGGGSLYDPRFRTREWSNSYPSFHGGVTTLPYGYHGGFGGNNSINYVPRDYRYQYQPGGCHIVGGQIQRQPGGYYRVLDPWGTGGLYNRPPQFGRY